MKRETLNFTILRYLRHLNSSEWIINEAYKFEFGNFLQSNINFKNQTDKEILEILVKSQTIKYDRTRGVQFIQKSGREELKTFIETIDVQLFRQLQTKSFDTVDWTNRTMSFTALSAWLASLFPDKLFPVPMTGLDKTINYLFETNLENFPKTGVNYITSCQDFFKQTQDELENYPIEEIHLNVWNKYFLDNPDLKIKPKKKFDQVDWNWLTQDFHLFIFRNILKLYKPKGENNKSLEISDDFEPTSIEGQGKLATHMRYERNSSLIRKIKMLAIRTNPMLNCEICGFSFYEKYGELGQGFIEAHHKRPLSETQKTKTTRDDIALICSNCHRMIHKGISQLDNNSIMTTDELKVLINE